MCNTAAILMMIVCSFLDQTLFLKFFRKAGLVQNILYLNNLFYNVELLQ